MTVLSRVSIDSHFHNRFIRSSRFRSISPLNVSMPELEESHLLLSEADVTRLSSYQLFHPVNIALQAVAPPGTKIICSAEKPDGRFTRFDVQWSIYSKDNKPLKALAILEVKKTHIIHINEFTPAEVTEHDFHVKDAKAFDKPYNSLLQGNAVWLAKQASKYAEESSCSDVAVFDYNAIFAFNFTLAKSSRGGPVMGTYFDEGSRSGRMTFRLFLFAFAMRPLIRYKLSM
ncbi:hypothetical protein CBS147346_5806 [Aspergillus niger]|nr:hypothetical protein CBS147346_5806 [Aspergillus niger]